MYVYIYIHTHVFRRKLEQSIERALGSTQKQQGEKDKARRHQYTVSFQKLNLETLAQPLGYSNCRGHFEVEHQHRSVASAPKRVWGGQRSRLEQRGATLARPFCRRSETGVGVGTGSGAFEKVQGRERRSERTTFTTATSSCLLCLNMNLRRAAPIKICLIIFSATKARSGRPRWSTSWASWPSARRRPWRPSASPCRRSSTVCRPDGGKHVYIYIYIYIYILFVTIIICVYIYIYTYIERERDMGGSR